MTSHRRASQKQWHARRAADRTERAEPGQELFESAEKIKRHDRPDLRVAHSVANLRKLIDALRGAGEFSIRWGGSKESYAGIILEIDARLSKRLLDSWQRNGWVQRDHGNTYLIREEGFAAVMED